MGRRNSVFNKRSQDRVTSSVKTQVTPSTKYTVNTASAQPASNPTTRTSVQSQPQQDTWGRATQFVQNIGRGAGDTARSYTTDIADSITGNYEERTMRDQTLSDVFITGALEGRLDDSWGEIGRRVTQEPGRVVGEAAVEAGFLIGTMGIGAAAKGVKVGATGVKVIRAADKSKGAVGFQRKTGIIKKGKEIKFIGDKTTETQKWSQKKGWTTKISKTKWTDRIEKRAMPLGGRITKNVKYAAPMVRGGSGGARYLDDLKVRGEFTSTKKSLGEGFQVGADSSMDPRYFDNAPVEQVINQGQEFSFGGRFPGVAPETSMVRRTASFQNSDGSIVKATTQKEFEALKNKLTKADIEKITYDTPEGRISPAETDSLFQGTANQINSNNIFLRSGSGVLDTSPDVVLTKVDEAVLKASGEGKGVVETVNIRNQYLNFYKQEAGHNTELASPILNIKQGVRVNDKDKIVSFNEEGVLFNTKSDPVKDMGGLGSLEGDIGISSVNQITSKTGRYQNTGFRTYGSKTKGGEQEAIQNPYNANAGSELPYDLTIKPTRPYYSFSGTPDGVKPVLRNMPGSSGGGPIDVEKRFTKMFLETNTPGQDFRRLNIGATGSPKRTEFVNVLTSQLIKKNKADPKNQQTTKVYKQVAETMAEESYNIPMENPVGLRGPVQPWLVKTNTLKKDAINMKLRNEPGVEYNAMALIDGYGTTDVWRVKNKLTAGKREYVRKSMKGKGETRLNTGDPFGSQTQPMDLEFIAAKSIARKEGLSDIERNAIRNTVKESAFELDSIMKTFGMGATTKTKKRALDIPVRPPGNTNQNNPWFGGKNTPTPAERKAMLKANIKARKEALAKAPKAKRRRSSKRNAPASKSITELSFGDNWEINDPSDILRSFNY